MKSKREAQQDVEDLERAWAIVDDPSAHGGIEGELHRWAQAVIDRWKSGGLVDVNTRGRADVRL